jgi:hypothetical protein
MLVLAVLRVAAFLQNQDPHGSSRPAPRARCFPTLVGSVRDPDPAHGKPDHLDLAALNDPAPSGQTEAVNSAPFGKRQHPVIGVDEPMKAFELLGTGTIDGIVAVDGRGICRYGRRGRRRGEELSF